MPDYSAALRRPLLRKSLTPQVLVQRELAVVDRCGTDVVFTRAAFDPRDARVQIMFDGTGDGGRHLTRSIGGITGIQALRERGGRDVMLRVAHGRGQTLVTFER